LPGLRFARRAAFHRSPTEGEHIHAALPAAGVLISGAFHEPFSKPAAAPRRIENRKGNKDHVLLPFWGLPRTKYGISDELPTPRIERNVAFLFIKPAARNETASVPPNNPLLSAGHSLRSENHLSRIIAVVMSVSPG
jgi:hypothetical protein